MSTKGFKVDEPEDDFIIEDSLDESTKLMVFGVGGAGGNAVAHMVDSGVNNVDYVIANTDVAALRNKDATKMERIQIGRKTTKGRGAGNDPSKGKTSAEENRDDIEARLEDVAMLFVAAGMGGGTGTGAAPVVASIAKEKEILTVGVVTKPFNWEGANKMQMAIGGINEMKKSVDALIVIPNDRVRELKAIKPDMLVEEMFAAVDDILCKAVSSMIKVLSGEGYINLDFADVTMALKDSGIAHIALGFGKGKNKVDDALNEVMNSPLLETSIDGARRGIMNISIPRTMRFEEFDSLTHVISEKFNKDAKFKAGVVFDSTLEDDEVSIIVVATDFATEAPAPIKGTAVQSIPVEGPTPRDELPEDDDRSAQDKPGNSQVFDRYGSTSEIDVLLNKFNEGRNN